MKKSVTLMELLIAVGLFMVIILGATTFHFASTEFLRSSERKADVLNELTMILEHLDKNIRLATGDADNVGINISQSGNVWTLTVRQDLRADINAAGTLWASLYTPDDYDDDRSVRYVFDPNNNRITFSVLYNSGGVVPNSTETLTDRFSDLAGGNPFGVVMNYSGVYIENLALRYSPGENDRFSANVSMVDTGNSPPAQPVIFFPFSHSLSL